MTTTFRSQMGSFGTWLHPRYDDEARAEFASEAEDLGYTVAWLGLGQASVTDLEPVERALQATSTLIVATAIVNMWTNDADEIAASYHRITSSYGDRFLLGIGIGHPEVVASFQKPYAKMVDYLSRLDAAGVPADRRILAALGPRALRLAAGRTLGTHPYLVVPEHTRAARAALGPGIVIAPEQTIVLDDDAQAARGIAKAFVSDPYLSLSNYTNNWRRHGFDDSDLDADGSDRLIDALVPHGAAQSVAARLREHLGSGADHIGIQLLTSNNESPMPGYAALARELFNA